MVCAEFSVCFWHCSWSSHFCPRLRWQRIRRGLTKPSPRPSQWTGTRRRPIPPAQEQPKNENPPAPEEPKTFTVTYTDGVGGAVFDNEVHSNLPSGTATPAFSGSLAREGYTFAGWNPAVAETVTADVTYAAKWEEGKTGPRRVTLPTIPGPDVDLAALDTGHKIDVRFTVLYVGDEFNIGYNYGSSEKTKFVCQYKTNHSDTAYNNHTIAISDIKAAASRASVNSGYQIVGWSKESNANPTTWSLNKSGTTACNKGSTIYLVAKNPNPTTKYTYTLNYDANGGTGAPSADSWSTTDASIRYHSFTVKNTIPTREGYVFKGWKAKDGADTIYAGGALCSVSQQGNDVVKNGNTWTRTLYAVWEEAVPSKPEWSDIRREMQKVSVHVTCINPDVNHTEKTYSYKESNDDTIGSVQDSAGSYTCTVTVHLGRYRLQYNQDFNREHEFASSLTADVVLQYNGTGWVIASALPLELKLTCGSAPTPNPPGSDVLNSLKVLVKCDSKTYHFEKPYKMDDGDYRLEKVDDNTYTVIVLADKYVEKYNAVYPGHTLFDNNTKTIKLVYRYGAWTVVGSNGVTFNVSCEQKYTVTYTDGVDGEVIFADQVSYKKPGEKTPKFRGTPTRTGYKFIGWEPAVVGTVTANATYTAQWVSISDLDPAPELVSSLYMNFQCTNENASHDHRSEMIAIGYGIGAGGVIVTDAAGNPVYNKDGNITAVITFYQDSGFLNEYNKRTGVAHRYADYEPKTKSVDGVLIGEVFHMYKKDYPVVFDVVCGSLYTVTYKDGTNGTVFADDVHSNLNANAATPAFVGGTPTRPGYVFTGWNPAVAATVTGNATYTAVWEKDANGNGKPDKDEEKYTVTYTDGVENEEIFADETYSDLLSGTATPAFNGTPTRKGYAFTGWNPAVAATVTGNATYAAVWEEAAPPKPDKPTPPTDEIGGATVAVKCITGHGDLSWKIDSSTFTVGEVTGDDTTGYTCTVTVQAEVYVNAFNSDKKANGVKHTLADDAEKTFTMTYVNGAWTGPTNPAVTFEVKCEEELVPVHLVIYRNGDTSKAYKDVALESQPKGHVIDLSTIDIADYYTGNYEFYGWYDDGAWNNYKANPANPPAGLKEKTVNGWTNLKCMVYDKYQVVYFQSEEALRDFQNDHSKTEGRLYSTTALFGSTLPTADAPTPTRTGYTFKFWSREGQNGDVTGQTVNGWTNLYAVWEKNTYTVTYTDGVDGEAFADQAYTAKYEDATPAFEGTPTRKGFVFDGWNPEVAETVTEDVTYTAQWKPVQPDKKAIEGAIGRGVAVVCDNQNVKHGAKAYKVTLGEYTASNVMGTAADGYTCTVTVRAAKFIEKYSSDMSDAVHTLIAGEPAEKTIELKWNGEKWVAETELPVTFHTLCPPEQPSKKDIEGAIGRGVKIVCDNQNVKHGGKDYKPTQGEYTVSDVTGTASEGYTCTITVKAAKIIEKYSSDMGKTHALIVGEQAEKTVELKWDGEKWVAKTELPITFHVECPPEKPTYDELKGLGINAKVDCTTTTAHNGKSYTLIEDTYNVSDPERKGTAYTCILTVNAKDYVAKYNAEENVGPHTLDDRDSKTIELTWNGEKWTAAETSVTFNVKCELLTVTYTDGVKGEEVFADVVYNDIPYGTNTPAFGTKDPTRKGYKFLGWEPVVADTVTENATYVAQWEKLYTVTYTDGAKGKAFEDQVFTDLESGTKTPEFNGTPTRKGYKFLGWEPVVADTVTENVTYTAPVGRTLHRYLHRRREGQGVQGSGLQRS